MRRTFAVAAVLLAVAGLVVMWAMDDEPTTPSGDGSATSAGSRTAKLLEGEAVAQPGLAAGGSTPDAEAAKPTPTARCALHVHVQMPDGFFLPGFGVRVRPMKGDAPGRHAMATGTTDEGGNIQFELPPGRVFCEVGFVEGTASEVVTLTPDAPTTVVLVSPARSALVFGTVTREGEPVAGRDVVLRGRDTENVAVWARMKTDPRGVYRGVIRPGSYHLQAAGAPSDTMIGRGNVTWWVPGGHGPWLHQGPIELTGTEHIVRRDIQLPPTRVTCTVRRAGTQAPLARARVFLRRVANDQDFATRATGDDGVVVFADLPFGEFAWEVRHDGSVSSAPQRFSLSPSAHTATLDVGLSPAARLVLEARDDRGAKIVFSRVGRPFVEHVESGRRFEGKETPSPKGIRPPRRMIFDDLASGLLRVTLEDRRVDGKLIFASLGPPQTHDVTLKAGDDVPVVLRGVHRRAAVQLRVDLADGKVDPGGDVIVYDDSGQQIGQTRWSSGWHGPGRWSGFLAPGRYRVQLRNGAGDTWDVPLEVARKNVTRRFTGP